MSEITEYNGFKVGERVRYIGGARKYNNQISIPIGSIGVVQEPCNDGWPSDCLQLQIDGGYGAVDIRCLERTDKPAPKRPPERHNQTLVEWVMRHHEFELRQFTDEEQLKIHHGDIDRAGGDVRCEHCGQLYMNHPRVKGFTWLVVTCDWRFFKL